MKMLKSVRFTSEMVFPGPQVTITNQLSQPANSGHTIEWRPDGSIVVRHPQRTRYVEVSPAAILAYDWEDVAVPEATPAKAVGK